MSDREACHVEPVVKVVTMGEEGQIEALMLAISGMGCPNCAARVRNSLLNVYGVVEADVVHTLGMAQVFYNPTLASGDELVAAVARAGGDGRHEYCAQLVEARRA
jgi:copper chaperone CopZ